MLGKDVGGGFIVVVYLVKRQFLTESKKKKGVATWYHGTWYVHDAVWTRRNTEMRKIKKSILEGDHEQLEK